jgi:imidazole glycerol-phosphate synthase subunit HisH
MTADTVHIISHGMGNIASVANMLRRIGAEVCVSASPDVIKSANKLILPGVGAFDAGVTALRDNGLDAAISEAVTQRGATLLGICLGMQLMMNSSEEGALAGLGLVPGRVVRFHGEGLRVPHMGWNRVDAVRGSVLFDERQPQQEQRFYFVHSYHVVLDDPRDVTAEAQYGGTFTCAFEHGRTLGVQFHPEKSHRFGMALLKRFMDA